ncbi:hypothetical protein FRC04_004255 [Tulasnella sp. 424]|nr:hypothetical protein FRC04_004255 [Tulasnella sp. 424]KAG8979379.1 hypothetical protein FRC05_008364 [Tulasnella sp. 425]
MQLSVALLALFAAAASSAAVPRASDKCHTVHDGYLAAFLGDNPEKWIAFGLNKKNQVTYGGGDPLFKVEFQSCPKLPGQKGSIDDWKGRIVVSGSSNCITVTNPNGPEGGPFFLAVSKCGDNVNPPASQQWEWGNDFGAVVMWVRAKPEATVIVQSLGQKKLSHPVLLFLIQTGASKEDEIGYTIDAKSNPVTESGTHRIELGCANSCASFGIKPKSQLSPS